MRRLANRRPLLLAAIIVALVVVVVFGGRAAWRLTWRLVGPPPPPRQTDVTLIADWMSVPYVSRAYRVPSEELYKALGAVPDGHRMTTIGDLAEEQGIPSEQAVEQVQAAVRDWQAAHPRPGRAVPTKPPDAPDPPWPPLPPDAARGPPGPPEPSSTSPTTSPAP
jgi:hypothetical protein